MKKSVALALVLLLIGTTTCAACSSDFECGIGYRCVKAPLQSSGTWMKFVDEYGIQQFDLPSLDSVGPNTNLQGDCDFDTDCNIGFRCHPKYKVCVKR